MGRKRTKPKIPNISDVFQSEVKFDENTRPQDNWVWDRDKKGRWIKVPDDSLKSINNQSINQS